jgi:hypothetical protein
VSEAALRNARFLYTKFARFRTREKMKAQPECFPRAGKDRAPEAACRRGAEQVNFSYAKSLAGNYIVSSEIRFS